MTFFVPELYMLQLTFKALSPIRHLNYFHGPQWNAMFRTLLKKYLEKGTNMAEAGIHLQPIETGICRYEKDDPICIGISFPAESASAVCEMLANLNTSKTGSGHFQPGNTVKLEKTTCRVSGRTFPPEKITPKCLEPIDYDLILPEIKHLCTLDSFDLVIYSPLRLKRPPGTKNDGHTYFDPDFFFAEPWSKESIAAFVRAIQGSSNIASDVSPLAVAGGALTLIDNNYGRYSIPLGGVVGIVHIAGRPSRTESELLVLGQYTGLGKNRTFGLGYFLIPQLRDAAKILPLKRGKGLFERAISPRSLAKALECLPDSSPGPDGLTKADMKKAGEIILERLNNALLSGEYVAGGVARYRQKKRNGGYREIMVQDFADRIVHRALSNFLQPVVENILSKSAYAFRKGLNTKGAIYAVKNAINTGYTRGIKADISAFFESVDLNILSDILHGLFPFDRFPTEVTRCIKHMEQFGVKGLPQGSPLSPTLSNLYLDRFDKMMNQLGFKLIRYCDDFVLLTKPPDSPENCRELIEKTLAEIGLSLAEDKTVEISGDSSIEFLGYRLIPGKNRLRATSNRSKDSEQHLWLPVFSDNWITGHPVYLSSVCRGCYSSGPELVVKLESGEKKKIPWNTVSRIVVVGRSSFSSGVIYRAVKEQIPVTFIDVMGRSRGQLYPTPYDPPNMVSLQKSLAENAHFRLQFSKEIVSAKIHNRYVVLRRNSINEERLKYIESQVLNATNLDQLRGFEGNADKIYFRHFGKLVEPFAFEKRVYHPPDSPINALLSFGFTLLHNRIASALRDKGYDPRIGFFHQPRGRHFALASDLMEELRHIVDRVVLALVHRREIKPDDFKQSRKGGKEYCSMGGEAVRVFIRRFERTMAIKSSYYSKEKISCNAYIDEMADTLKRAMKLKIPYRPIRIR